MLTRLAAAAQDIGDAVRAPWRWHALAWLDIRQRHARTALGPLWLTIGIVLQTLAITLVFQSLMQPAQGSYLAYVAFGLVVWTFVQTLIVEAGSVFAGAADIIRNAPLPLTLHIMRLVWRNILILLHNLAAVTVVLALAGDLAWPHWTALPAALLLVLAAGGGALLLALVCARWRDVGASLASATQLLFFLTPIFWYPGQLLGTRAHLVAINPVATFVDLLRAPLMGLAPTPATWLIAGACTVLLLVLGFAALAVAGRRVVFWV